MNALSRWFGVELDEVSWKEKLVSAVGGALAILAVAVVSHRLIGLDGAPMLIASMGASAVLLFAVPHGQLSQPWPVLGGHLISALIGVSCAKLIPGIELAGACAVGLAIGAMHQFKCIHPPGGATALTAVIAGPAVTSLGYSFVWRPVLLNAGTIVVIAVVINWAFPWRRYPAHLVRRRALVASTPKPSHEQILSAVRSIDSFVDVTEDDLIRLYQLMSRHPELPADDR